jgi:hypothetical protein
LASQSSTASCLEHHGHVLFFEKAPCAGTGNQLAPAVPSDGIVGAVMHIHSRKSNYFRTINLSVVPHSCWRSPLRRCRRWKRGMWRSGTSRYVHPRALLAYVGPPPVGERRVKVQQKYMVAHITKRDYNSFRLALAVALIGDPELEEELPGGSRMNVPPGVRLYCSFGAFPLHSFHGAHSVMANATSTSHKFSGCFQVNLRGKYDSVEFMRSRKASRPESRGGLRDQTSALLIHLRNSG